MRSAQWSNRGESPRHPRTLENAVAQNSVVHECLQDSWRFIDPSTGQPYPKVTIYPPPPKWPTDISWCSMVGIFCPKDPFAATTPTREQCVAAEGRCFNKCTDIYVYNPDSLPGTGTNYHGRFKRCMRECLAGTGCEHNY